MKAFLTVKELVEPEPCASTSEGLFPLAGCNLTRHTDGSWNFNMSIYSEFSAYKVGQKVDGSILGGKFYAWELIKTKQ